MFRHDSSLGLRSAPARHSDRSRPAGGGVEESGRRPPVLVREIEPRSLRSLRSVGMTDGEGTACVMKRHEMSCSAKNYISCCVYNDLIHGHSCRSSKRKPIESNSRPRMSNATARIAGTFPIQRRRAPATVAPGGRCRNAITRLWPGRRPLRVRPYGRRVPPRLRHMAGREVAPAAACERPSSLSDFGLDFP